MENDESILFVTDDLSKEEIIERLKKICQFRFNISTLVNGVITILSSTQWYFSGDILERGKLSPSGGMIMSKSPSPMHNDTSVENEDNIEGSHFILQMDRKKRFRAFYDMKPFFEKKYYAALINYVSTQKGASNPTHTLCAYEIGLMQEISPEAFRTLVKNHTLINEMNYDALIDPSANMPVILLYDKQDDLDKAVSTYINKGLKRGQTCSHASVSLANESYLENFSSQNTNYQEHLEKGNLIVIDLVPIMLMRWKEI